MREKIALQDWEDLMFYKTINSELGKYDPEYFAETKHKIQIELDTLKIGVDERTEARIRGQERAYEQLKPKK